MLSLSHSFTYVYLVSVLPLMLILTAVLAHVYAIVFCQFFSCLLKAQNSDDLLDTFPQLIFIHVC